MLLNIFVHLSLRYEQTYESSGACSPWELWDTSDGLWTDQSSGVDRTGLDGLKVRPNVVILSLLTLCLILAPETQHSRGLIRGGSWPTKTCVLSTNAQSRFASVVIHSVLGPLRLA